MGTERLVPYFPPCSGCVHFSSVVKLCLRRISRAPSLLCLVRASLESAVLPLVRFIRPACCRQESADFAMLWFALVAELSEEQQLIQDEEDYRKSVSTAWLWVRV